MSIRTSLKSVAGSFVLLSLASSAPALAGDSPFTLAPVPAYKSPDGTFEFSLRGRVYWDFASIEDDDDNQNETVSEFRAARTGFDARYGDFKVRMELDHSGNDTRFTDLYLSWKGPLEVKLGQFKIETSLEEATSSRYTSFMERASFTDAFAFGRQLGIAVAKGGDNWHVKLGLQKGTTAAGLGDATLSVAARGTYSPRFGEAQAHFGLSLRYRETTGTQGDFSYSQRPHSHLGKKFLATGAITDSDFFYGLEAAVLWGPLSFQSEYSRLDASLSTPAAGLKDPNFDGGYVSATWFITGESRNYNPKKGGFGRTSVKNPVQKGGVGAWQVALRYDFVDLTDGGIFGGEQKTFIFGINWYLNRWARIMFNYAQTTIDKAQGVALNGDDGINGVDSFGFRTQISW